MYIFLDINDYVTKVETIFYRCVIYTPLQQLRPSNTVHSWESHLLRANLFTWKNSPTKSLILLTQQSVTQIISLFSPSKERLGVQKRFKEKLDEPNYWGAAKTTLVHAQKFFIWALTMTNFDNLSLICKGRWYCLILKSTTMFAENHLHHKVNTRNRYIVNLPCCSNCYYQ